MSERLENFERAFSSGCSGCVRDCHCGRTFFDGANSYDWEEGELEGLRKNKKATALPYSVGTIVLEGKEFVMDCDCWHKRAETVMDWIDRHGHSIAEFLSLEKKTKERIAEDSPVVK